MNDQQLTKKGTPRKRKPGAGRPDAGTEKLTCQIKSAAMTKLREDAAKAGKGIGGHLSDLILG